MMSKIVGLALVLALLLGAAIAWQQIHARDERITKLKELIACHQGNVEILRNELVKRDKVLGKAIEKVRIAKDEVDKAHDEVVANETKIEAERRRQLSDEQHAQAIVDGYLSIVRGNRSDIVGGLGKCPDDG